MNYLAHAYLSFGQPGILTGNMISDFVKGKKKFDYPVEVQKGIMLHRLIDTFTDDSPITKNAKTVFKPFVALYAGAFMDVVYDHFLATDENEFPNDQLENFASHTYDILYSNIDILPQRFALMLPYMKKQDWLFNYSTIEGTKRSFEGVVRRAAYLDNSTNVFEAFLNNYEALKQSYFQFFPALKAYTKSELDKLMTV